MIAFLSDEDFNGRIIRGLFRLVPDLNLHTVSGSGLRGRGDSTVISWAAENGRVLLTHDLNTMIDAALDRMRMGQAMPGAVVVPQRMSIGAAIFDLALIATCADMRELAGQIWYLPL